MLFVFLHLETLILWELAPPRACGGALCKTVLSVLFSRKSTVLVVEETVLFPYNGKNHRFAD